MRTRCKLLFSVLLLTLAALLGFQQPASAERQTIACAGGVISCSCNGHFRACVTSVEECWNLCNP